MNIHINISPGSPGLYECGGLKTEEDVSGDGVNSDFWGGGAGRIQVYGRWAMRNAHWTLGIVKSDTNV